MPLEAIVDTCPVPPIDDPIGRYLHQPEPRAMLFDASHVVMTEQQFRELYEYSATIPIGVYPGRCWRRHDGVYRTRPRKPLRWLLCWYGPMVDGRCPIEYREILTVEGDPRC